MHHHLESLLQFVVTDASCIARLPDILDHLSPSGLVPSPQLQKWVARVTSLMHSKDPAARWAAICIAYRMSFLSKSLLVDNAQSWVGIIFPSLSKPEPVSILRVSVRYLSLVFCVAGDNPEFQRQVAIPIVPKVSSALLTIAEKHDDQNIKALSIQTLARLVPLYSSSHKALSQRLFALCNQIFSGTLRHVADSLLNATLNLYSALHFLGGKVGGTNLWRNCLDEVLQISWSAWLALRTTFPASTYLCHKAIGYVHSSDGKQSNPIFRPEPMIDNPLETVALNLNRLKCGVGAISALLRASVNRPVRLPIGQLTTFCWCLLASSLDDEEGQSHIDPHVRAAESAVIPQIWAQACYLLSCLAETTRGLLVPHTPRLIMIISSHLENKPDKSQGHAFLRCAYCLLCYCPIVGASFGINRLLKATISVLSPLYRHQSPTEARTGAAIQPRANKKRRREYEVENVLSTTNIAVCTTIEERDVLIAAIDVVGQCMLNTELVPSTRSLANRILLSILLSLSSIPPSSLSSDLGFHGRVIKKINDICIESVQGTTHVMGKSTSFLLHSLPSENFRVRDKLHSHVDLLLHPRRPPFVRTLPFMESLSLSTTEENAEEMATRRSLDLVFGDGEIYPITHEQRTHPDPVSQSPLALDPQAPANPPQEGTLPTSIEFQPPTPRDSEGGLPVASSPAPFVPPIEPKAIPNIKLVGSPLLISEKRAPTVYVTPMLVDESDHESVPTIDLDSDSDV